MKRAALIVLGFFGTLMMLAAACGGDDVAPTLTRGPATSVPPTATAPPATVPPTTVPPATTPPLDTVAPSPIATSGLRLEISVDGDALTFDRSDFEVTAGAEVVLVLDNVSVTNQHNWVLVNPGTKDDVAGRGITHPATNWLEPGDSDVLANTILLNPETSGEVTFTAPPAGTYQFVCTFPGHSTTMSGDFVVTP